MTDDTESSILAGIGKFLAPIFFPLGWGNWQATVATITGIVAKENIVGTMGVLYGFTEDGGGYGQFAAAFTPLAAYSLLAFNLLCAPCFAAIGAVRREMMSGKWTAFALTYQCGFAYVVSMIIYQLGSLFSGHGFNVFTAVAWILLGIIIYMTIRPGNKPSARPILKGV
jgi:ferrous iron transport protein B